MATAVASVSVEPQALMQAAHDTAGLDDIVAAYAALELKEHELWVQKHVRPDETVFILHDVGAAAFGKGNDVSFSWAFGPIILKASINTGVLSINASLGVSIPFLGFKELAAISGDLSQGVSADVDAYAVKGKVTIFLKDGKQVWIRLELSSPFFSAQGKEFKIFTLYWNVCGLFFSSFMPAAT
ncbi:hypothetical protein BDV93DRAFT_545064 [Ceratobasidium sp. AG-I]|nr:hypothetical protein BDV93DRAFT_545064 [Ceratobasidium sp. AG-I]